jgi:hypothetical protein
MIRALVVAAAVYAYGHPAFDGYRPPVLDKPLQGFHAEVNVAARNGRRALASFDEESAIRYLNVYIQRVDTALRSKE